MTPQWSRVLHQASYAARSRLPSTFGVRTLVSSNTNHINTSKRTGKFSDDHLRAQRQEGGQERLGPARTRVPLRDRYCTGPYEPIDPSERPIYPKRKSPFKRAKAIIDAIQEEEQARLIRCGRAVFPTKVPNPRSGDIIRVGYVQRPAQQKWQYFTGICMGVKNRGIGSTFLLRNVVDGVAVERRWPVYSPLIKDAEVIGKRRVRRNKLYYLRDKPMRDSSFGNALERPEETE